MATSEAEATRIMVAVNESSIWGYPHASISCQGAFEWTLQKIVRSNASGFMLQFLHVQVPDEDGLNNMDSTYASSEAFRSEKLRLGFQLLEYFVTRCHQIGVACEAWIKKGDAKEVICAEAKSIQPDLLVVGSRALSPFLRVVAGSVSDFCVKHAECPTVMIKRRPEVTPQNPVDD